MAIQAAAEAREKAPRGEFGLHLDKLYDGNDMLIFARFYMFYIVKENEEYSNKFWILREFDRLKKLKEEGKIPFIHPPTFDMMHKGYTIQSQITSLTSWIIGMCEGDLKRAVWEMENRGYYFDHTMKWNVLCEIQGADWEKIDDEKILQFMKEAADEVRK